MIVPLCAVAYFIAASGIHEYSVSHFSSVQLEDLKKFINILSVSMTG